jgi:hypothetical protein
MVQGEREMMIKAIDEKDYWLEGTSFGILTRKINELIQAVNKLTKERDEKSILPGRRNNGSTPVA